LPRSAWTMILLFMLPMKLGQWVHATTHSHWLRWVSQTFCSDCPQTTMISASRVARIIGVSHYVCSKKEILSDSPCGTWMDPGSSRPTPPHLHSRMQNQSASRHSGWVLPPHLLLCPSSKYSLGTLSVERSSVGSAQESPPLGSWSCFSSGLPTAWDTTCKGSSHIRSQHRPEAQKTPLSAERPHLTQDFTWVVSPKE
jgi:hypothetical protein